MRSIYKYNLLENRDGIICGPITKILTVDTQRGQPVLWAEVDTEKPNRKIQTLLIGTGWDLTPPKGETCILDDYHYIGTVQVAGETLVFHVYVKEHKKIDSPKVATSEVSNPSEKVSHKETKESAINSNLLKHFL